MLARTHQIRLTGRLVAGAAALFAALAMLVISAPASAATQSQSATLVPAAVQTPVGVTGAQVKRKKKHPKKPGMGALAPKKKVAAVTPAGAITATLPSSVDLSNFSVAVGNQGALGSCVTWAIDYALLGWYSNRYGAKQTFNPMYTYSQIHISKTDPGGGGSYPEDTVRGGVLYRGALNVAMSQGNDTMSHYSHGTNDFVSQPNTSERTNAASFKISGFQTLFAIPSQNGGGTAGQELIKVALAAGKPVAISMRVRPGFTMWNRADAASATDNDVTGGVTGAHEILATGYDAGGLWIQNSWGATYGFKGYSRLSWAVVQKDVFDAHTITGFVSGSNPTPNPTPNPNPNPSDTTPPTMSSVTQSMSIDSQTTSSAVPVKFNWSATDASGISAYAVYVKTDSADWALQAAVPSNATQYTFTLSFGHTYQVAVKAKDAAGNWSAFSYDTVAPSVFDDTDFSSVSSPWTRYSLTDSLGGSYIAASTAGAYVQKSFTGRDIALVAPKFASAGRFTVSCDGGTPATGDLYGASTVGRQIVATCHFAQSGNHTIKVTSEGTSGRPWLAMDAFAILS